MTPTIRIEQIDTKSLSPSQSRSMLDYLLASLAVITDDRPTLPRTAAAIADAVERARYFGSRTT